MPRGVVPMWMRISVEMDGKCSLLTSIRHMCNANQSGYYLSFSCRHSIMRTIVTLLSQPDFNYVPQPISVAHLHTSCYLAEVVYPQDIDT